MSADIVARGLIRRGLADLASTGPAAGAALIGFRHERPGSIARTLADTGEETVSVKDFGALGNGIADDTLAIQTAINAVLSVTGGALYFPDGTYRITAKLVIPFATGWRIFGQSRGGTIIRQSSNNTRIFSLEADLTHSWEIAELTLTWASAQGAANSEAVAIFMGTGVSGGGGFFNWQVRRCTFSHAFRAISGAASSSNPIWGAQISECTFNGNRSGAAVFLVPAPAVGQPNITINDCFVDAGQSATEGQIIIGYCDSLRLSSLEFVNGTWAVPLMTISSCPGVTLLNVRSEYYNAGAAQNQTLFNFSQCNVTVIRCSCSGIFGSGGGLTRFIGGNTDTRLSIFGLQCSSDMTGGAVLLAYSAAKIPFVADVVLSGGFTDNIRGQFGVSAPVPGFDADKRQVDAVTFHTDTNATLTSASDRLQVWNTALSANRTCTLPGSGIAPGAEFEIALRQGSPGNFSLSVVDPVSGRNWTIPAQCNGFVRYRWVGYWEIVDQAIYRSNGSSEPVFKDTSGNVGIGTSSPGHRFDVRGGDLRVTRGNSAAADAAVYFGSGFGNYLYGGDGSNSFVFGVNGYERFWLTGDGTVRPHTDNTQWLGNASHRWSVVYAGTGTINTSDARDKIWRGTPSAAELRAAQRITGELGFYQWHDALAEKGSAARYHFGPRAQHVWQIMAEEQLVEMIGEDGRPGATPYAFLCFDQWNETPAEAASRPLTHPHCETVDGPTLPARSAIPAGYRYGLRLDQLALFLIAAQTARIAALERGWLARLRAAMNRNLLTGFLRACAGWRRPYRSALQ